MGNFKWNLNDSNKELPYVVVFMTARNKDNKNVKNFKQRKQAMFCTKDMDKIYRKFEHFVEDGVPGEFCRLYVSLNARDVNKVKKALLHMLIDEDICFDYLDGIVAGIAARRENAAEKKWFFDFDLDSERAVCQFKNDIYKIDATVDAYEVKTPHGYAVVVDHGFDTRELMQAWGDNVSLKRDDLICMKWGVKDEKK